MMELAELYERSSVCGRVQEQVEQVEPLLQSDRRLTGLARQYVTGFLWQVQTTSAHFHLMT